MLHSLRARHCLHPLTLSSTNRNVILIIKFDHEDKRNFHFPCLIIMRCMCLWTATQKWVGFAICLTFLFPLENGSSWVPCGPMGRAEVSPSSLTSIWPPQWWACDLADSGAGEYQLLEYPQDTRTLYYHHDPYDLAKIQTEDLSQLDPLLTIAVLLLWCMHFGVRSNSKHWCPVLTWAGTVPLSRYVNEG